VSLRDLARPQLEELARKTQEATKLGILDGHDVIYLDGIESPQAVRAFVPVGGRAPAHVSATGKAILAHLPAERLERLGTARYAPRTAAAADAFARDLAQIRRRGYAVNRGEWDAQVGAVAAPVFDAAGAVVACLGIILPASRLTGSRVAEIGTSVASAAAAVSARLGHDARLKRTG
jgi:DNA-binding IclR family transcriptional regulator